jgi:hypothetical protein
MAKIVTACWEVPAIHWRPAMAVLLALFAVVGRRQPASEPAAATSAAAAASSFREVPPAPRPLAWVRVPKIAGHLGARDIGLVINTADPYSVEVGAFYAAARHLAPEQILRVDCPSRRC